MLTGYSKFLNIAQNVIHFWLIKISSKRNALPRSRWRCMGCPRRPGSSAWPRSAPWTRGSRPASAWEPSSHFGSPLWTKVPFSDHWIGMYFEVGGHSGHWELSKTWTGASMKTRQHSTQTLLSKNSSWLCVLKNPLSRRGENEQSDVLCYGWSLL